MDYTAILSHIESIFTGTGGILLVAAIGVGGIIGAHILRMRSSRTHFGDKSKSYRDVVIMPYVDEESGETLLADHPKLSSNQDQF